MKTKERLNAFFEATGISKLWFAKKIGITGPMLYGILAGKWLIPKKYWEKVISLSQGYVIAEHLISDQVHHSFKEFSLIQVEEFWYEGKWEIKAKKPQKNP